MTPKDLPELVEALRTAVRQNSHDMLMTGEELRACEAALEAYELGARSTAAQPVEPTVTPTEAVVGFASWVTCRPGTLPAGEGHDAAPWSEAVHEFVVAQGWPTVRDVFPHNLKRPPLSAPPAASGDSTPPSAPVQGDPSGALRPEPEAADHDSRVAAPRITGSPKEIWLNYGDIEADCTHDECYRLGDVTWCQDKVFDSDVRYVLAGQPPQASGERGD